MQSIDRSAIIKVLRNFRFIVVENSSESAILEYLRSIGIANLFQIHRIKGYTIIEPNTIICERECNPYCIESNGKSMNECLISCINACIDSKIEYILTKLS
ncbi:MAG: hypothetical protein QXJ56_05400 [Ignisphaera sp.]|uniref:Uncharacterized protein n=1 Tax=Ignisphaera aggregans TaxID=334771 RepID=A0A7J3I6G2_9CREN